jgi:AcrR family transcriptional regulator
MPPGWQGNAVTASEIENPETGPARAPRKTARLRDARSLRSQELLRGALFRLIETRQFDKITLREITAEAGVSYPTFFNHYQSKEQLFQDISRKEVGDLLAAFRTDVDSPHWRPGVGICAHVLEHRGLWRTLLTTGASEAMRSEFIRRGREMVGDRRPFGHGFPFDMISGVIASGIFEIVSWWLSQDDYPAETVADMLETLVIEPALNVPPGHFTRRNKA